MWVIEQLLHRNVQRFRGGLVFKAHRLCVSLNSRLKSNKEEEDLQEYAGPAVGSEGRMGRWGTPIMALHIRIDPHRPLLPSLPTPTLTTHSIYI